ncbi:hypothetical protein SAMN04488550_1173 [Gordonia malaquae]|uniref:Uncharacterized protein n=1 Tax=Gordonia malaquae NBRC 108250 TaxID=1223542 RepID=M3UML7_GORML|nr:hypothetical protein [Gordonia malaquae]GAC81155.1 hypothetical protein GM1_029_00580 [Gordonia malaquae NBRC 108250]SEC01946.1 hypothetical protein SAMN04488550_1173 [Gordonia malaquae]
MPTHRPMYDCTAAGCRGRTRSASRLCTEHRQSPVGTVTVHASGHLSIHGIMHSPADALELANKIADALAKGSSGRL